MGAQKFISAGDNGWRVDIARSGGRLRRFVAYAGDRAAALLEAVRVRDELAAQLPLRPRSNTGVTGVTEVTHWTRNVPQPCFVVTVGKPTRNWKRRFFYRSFAQRESALRAAIAHRARVAGEDAAALLKAAGLNT